MIADCSDRGTKRGMCPKHYTRWRRHGDATISLKPRRSNRGYVEHGTPEAYNHHKCRCDICRSWRREYSRAYAAKNKVKLAGQYRERTLRRYGVTREHGERIFAEQRGACAICKVAFGSLSDPRIHADHDHATGMFRAFLCRYCNLGLGQFADSAERLRAAAQYLESHCMAGSVR